MVTAVEISGWATCYCWARRTKVGGMDASLVAGMKALNDGNRRLAQIYVPRRASMPKLVFCNHLDDLDLETEVEIAALPGHVNSRKGELSSYGGARRD